ncbi:MAG: hypothetical protein RQ735_02170 [Flavobacteriaceae bacterium]|nr:hypothetical protein [Flavobacteriaceae bacterium]
MYNKFFIICCVLLYSCGTGPWASRKKFFEVYKDPIYENSVFELRLDGAYLEQLNSKEKARYRSFYVFYKSGYCITGFISEKKWRDSFLVFFKNIKIHPKTGYSVYKIKNDSVWINDFDFNPNLYYRWSINYKGKILNDSMFYLYENETALEGYPTEKQVKNFKFYQINELPDYETTSWYLKKKWYQKNVHESRKQ